LEAGKTYYWRVDEFAIDEMGIPSVIPGEVWSFTTVPSVAIVDPHLVGWWTFDEGSSDTAVDSSGYGNHGTLIGGIERAKGFTGGALQFGSGKVVNCGTGAASQVTGNFTVAAWVKLDRGNAGIYGGIAGKLQYLNSNYFGFGIVRHSSNYFRLWVGDSSADLAKSAVSSNGACTDIEWHHVAGVRNGQANTLYVDGELQGGTSTTGFSPSTDWFHIGRQYSTQTDRTFPGLIDDVRVYDTAANAATIAQIMAGNQNVAGDPQPASGALVDIRDLPDLVWSAGSTAASHDVYFGADRQAVANADHNAAEFKGNQTDTSLSLADLVAFGGGDYYWRIDEVEADGVTVHKGYLWKLTMPDYLPVDDFESYTDNEEAQTTIFQTWSDGLTNGTGSYVGYDTARGGTFCEIAVVHGGTQSMPFAYNNADAPHYSETERSWTTAQDWTVEGADTLCLFVRGSITNGSGTLYVGLQDSANKVGFVTISDAQIPSTGAWTRLRIPLADFGVNAAKVKKMYIGIGDRGNPAAGGAGRIYIDDITVTR
ncbi:MAG TPA: LamG domain-containing protein, partial [Candidatus Anammoximicrobium sp.]|nr:LamG domain-containing protein [Candidatus Anammoximicrobium sp.]